MSRQQGIGCAAVGAAQGGAARAGLRAPFAPAAAQRAVYGIQISTSATFVGHKPIAARHAVKNRLAACFAAGKIVTVPLVI